MERTAILAIGSGQLIRVWTKTCHWQNSDKTKWHQFSGFYPSCFPCRYQWSTPLYWRNRIWIGLNRTHDSRLKNCWFVQTCSVRVFTYSFVLASMRDRIHILWCDLCKQIPLTCEKHANTFCSVSWDKMRRISEPNPSNFHPSWNLTVRNNIDLNGACFCHTFLPRMYFRNSTAGQTMIKSGIAVFANCSIQTHTNTWLNALFFCFQARSHLLFTYVFLKCSVYLLLHWILKLKTQRK